MPGPKPLYKKGKFIISKLALPGLPANSPMIIEKVFRGTKKEGYRHQYLCKDNNGNMVYLYESYVG